MKANTTKSIRINLAPGFFLLTGLVLGTVTIDSASAQISNTIVAQAKNSCSAGYTGTWIIGNTCDLGSATDLKRDDAIDVQCNVSNGQWSVDFYQEPEMIDGNISQATHYPICPGNGYITSINGRQVLKCDYWESVDNVVKQLELKLEPTVEVGIRSMSWLARETDNPNVVCGVAGRPDDGSATGSSGQTIN